MFDRLEVVICLIDWGSLCLVDDDTLLDTEISRRFISFRGSLDVDIYSRSRLLLFHVVTYPS